MPGVNDYGEPKTAQHRRGTQQVLNESWPLSDKSGGHARGIEDQPDPIDVEVRIEWAGARKTKESTSLHSLTGTSTRVRPEVVK